MGMSKKGKKHYIVAFTSEGKKYVNPQHVTRKRIDHPDLGEEIYDSLTLKEKLRTVIKEIRGYEKKNINKNLHKKYHKINGIKRVDKETAVKEIWLGLGESEKKTLSATEIAGIFMKTKAPSASRIDMVRNIINNSIKDELPYFNIGKNKKKYKILSKEKYNKINLDIKYMKKMFSAMGKYKKRKTAELSRPSDAGTLSQMKLRSIFQNSFEDWISLVELANEDTPVGAHYIPVKQVSPAPSANMPADVPHFQAGPVVPGFSSEDKIKNSLHRLFNSICHWMQDFVKRDDWGKDKGPGGSHMVKLDSFDPKRYMVELARLVTGLKKVSYSTLFTSFLIIMGYWTIEKAAGAYIERFVITKKFEFKLGYPRVFDEKLLSRKADTNNKNELKKRVDMRDLFTVTVDPVDAKDFDDAISMEKDGNKTVLYVHIADVSHYVAKGSPLDREAFYRCTSVYLPDTVLPMLPEILSNDYCSLREKVDRFAVSTKMVYDENMILVDFEIFTSVINVDLNLSYDMVLDYYHRELEPYSDWIDFSRALRGKRNQLKLETSEMKIHIRENKVEKKMKKGNKATEMIECFMVSTNEVVAMYVTSFTANTVYRVHSLPDTSGLERFNSIVERLGLGLKKFDDKFAKKKNEQSKDYQYPASENMHSSYEFNIRIEGDVDDGLIKAMGMNGISVEGKEEKWKNGMKTGPYDRTGFQKRLKEILLKKDEDKNNGNYVEKMKNIIQEHIGTLIDLDKREYLLDNINNVLEDINNSEEDERLKELLNISILRILSLAIYSPENIGHFGLASDCYSHFTSPIRRYADLVVHRNIKTIKENQSEKCSDEMEETIPINSNKDNHIDNPKNNHQYNHQYNHENNNTLTDEEAFSVSERCSEQSRNADKFEHVINDVCTCMDIMFDDDYLGSSHQGIVSGIIAGGVFVDLGSGVEGFIPRKKITRERIYLNEKETELIIESNIDSYKNANKWKKKNKKGKSSDDSKRVLLGIGDKILVKIKKISIEKGQFEFRIC
jgi:exoribonuclease R